MNKKEIFEKSLALEKISHNTWGDIFIRPLTIGDVDKINKVVGDETDYMATCLLLAMVDGQGQQIFDEADYDTIKRLPWKDTLLVAKQITAKLSGEVVEQKKLIESDLDLQFRLRLARTLHKTLEELSTMAWEEYVTWLAEWQRQPFGDDIDRQQRAIIGAAQVSMWSNSSVDPSRFIPAVHKEQDDQQKRQVKHEVFLAHCQAWNKRHGFDELNPK